MDLAFVFAASLAFYCATLAPTVIWGDSAWLAVDAYYGAFNIGTAGDHPLFVFIGHLLSGLPLDVARLVNFEAALFGALAVTMVYRCGRQLGKPHLRGWRGRRGAVRIARVLAPLGYRRGLHGKRIFSRRNAEPVDRLATPTTVALSRCSGSGVRDRADESPGSGVDGARGGCFRRGNDPEAVCDAPVPLVDWRCPRGAHCRRRRRVSGCRRFPQIVGRPAECLGGTSVSPSSPGRPHAR